MVVPGKWSAQMNTGLQRPLYTTLHSISRWSDALMAFSGWLIFVRQTGSDSENHNRSQNNIPHIHKIVLGLQQVFIKVDNTVLCTGPIGLCTVYLTTSEDFALDPPGSVSGPRWRLPPHRVCAIAKTCFYGPTTLHAQSTKFISILWTPTFTTMTFGFQFDHIFYTFNGNVISWSRGFYKGVG